MSIAYHDPADLARLKDMSAAAPAEFNAWLALDRIVAREDGAISRKYRELIAVAVAHTTQCVYCMDVHVAAAKRSGASRVKPEFIISDIPARVTALIWTKTSLPPPSGRVARPPTAAWP